MANYTTNNTSSQKSPFDTDYVDDIDIEEDVDYDVTAREYIKEILFNGKVFKDRQSFGEYEDAIIQFEKWITEKHIPVEGIIKGIKTDIRTKHLFEDEPVQEEDEGLSSFVELPEKARIAPEKSQGACPWLDDYEAYSKEASPEGYDDFHVFVGMSILSTVHAGRSYLQLGGKRVYGNLYLVLCAITSTAAKSFTTVIRRNVLAKAGLSYFVGPKKVTPEKLVNMMEGKDVPKNYHTLTPEKQEYHRRKIAMSAQKSLHRDEFGKFIRDVLRKNSSEAGWLTLLLELYDCPPDGYDAYTISRSADVIENPCLTLLGTMTYADLNGNAEPGADFWTDGFWARIGFIAAPTGYNKIDTLDAGKTFPISDDLINPLKEWDKQLSYWNDKPNMPECEIVPRYKKGDIVEGEYDIIKNDDTFPAHKCTITYEANKAYKVYRETLKRLFPDFDHNDFNGSYDRLAEQALRMAITMASIENNNHIELRHWAKAQELAELLRKSLHRLYDYVSSKNQESNGSKMDEAILHEIKQHIKNTKDKDVALSTLMNRHRKLQKYGAMEVSIRIDGMVKAGILKKENTTPNPRKPNDKVIKYSLAKGF